MTMVLDEFLRVIREFVALWHWISDILAVTEILQLVSEHGVIGSLALWLVSSIVSGLLAELLQSLIPTPLRPILRRLGVI
jgi:hypothetical protein